MHHSEVTAGQPLLIQLLVDRGTLTPKHLNTLREVRARDTSPLERVLINNALASDRDIAEAYAGYLALPLFEPPPSGTTWDPAMSRLLPEKLCRDQLIVPVAVDDGMLDMVFVTPNELLIVDEVQLLTGMIVRPLIGPLSVVEGLIDVIYDTGASGGNEFLRAAGDFPVDEEEEESPVSNEAEILHLDQPPPPGRDGRIIRLVNQILDQALRAGASDIHLEPFEGECKIRLRIDGLLNELPPPSLAQFLPIISRFKILAKMDIAEKRIPQDGAIALRSGNKRIDLRVNTVPTVYGEKMVMRLLDKGAIPLQLTGLGLDERQSNDLTEAIHSPHGMMLVTGPTGSGKSTTLYACLNLLNEPDTNISTIEDPVEYKFKGLNQVQVKPQVGLTFASALRAFLRQDPDIIMVGEVRDQETAEICLRTALTGHFVLSTLHTNDALAAVSRLTDMGIEPFLLSATVRLLMAQRLLRRLCKECREPWDVDAEVAQRHNLPAGQTLYRAKGCHTCRGIGYKGRVGVFEVIRITPRLAQLIEKRTPLPQLRVAAQEEGMGLLLDSALAKAKAGMTSLEEALSVTIVEAD
jgi:type IV pilus assembly protein PilB